MTWTNSDTKNNTYADEQQLQTTNHNDIKSCEQAHISETNQFECIQRHTTTQYQQIGIPKTKNTKTHDYWEQKTILELHIS